MKKFKKLVEEEKAEQERVSPDGTRTEFIRGRLHGFNRILYLLDQAEIAAKSDEHKFNAFYAHYPLKKSKAPARKAFAKLNPDAELYQKIMDAVTAQKASRQWQQKQYIPHPSTWLNQERWEDEVDTVDGLPTDDKYKGI